MELTPDSTLSRALSEISSSSIETPLEDLKSAVGQKLSQYHPSSSKDHTVKILDSFITHLPAEGSKTLCSLIKEDGIDLAAIANHLVSAVLLPMRACGGKPPHVDLSPLGVIDKMIQSMNESATHTEQRQLKKICLQRDAYHCIITGMLDANSRDHFPELSDDEFASRLVPTHASHIIPFKLGHFENDVQGKVLACIWTTLFKLFPDLENVIKPDLINEPRNVMTVFTPLHEQLGALRLALEPTADRDTYKIKTYKGFIPFSLSMVPTNERGERIVHFTKLSNIDTELPSPELIATHAVIAQILHAADMAETIDEILDVEMLRDLRQLAADGTTDIARHIAILALG